MKLYKNVYVYPLIVIILFSFGYHFYYQGVINCIVLKPNQNEVASDDLRILDQNPNPSDIELNNYQRIESIFQTKLESYNNLGYFPQFYEPSLQATYYALSVLDSIDKLNTINLSMIESYIMSLYNESTHLFMDDYTYRYLDIDFSKQYYPLTSVLEINCYAILALNIINRLDLINTQQMINFILSCYNPQTSGFIGQTYSVDLAESFKISTMDNTYYAILLIDLLSDWDLYPDKKRDLIGFINGLQSYESQDSWNFGGFTNDKAGNFDSLDMYEPNLLASYYCLKSLEIFNMIETININNFHQYLAYLYDEEKFYFHLYGALYDNGTNLAATAIGLELSILTQFSGVDTNAVLQFLFDNRNSQSTWDTSTENTNYELIDTFQIIRSLKNIGALSYLTSDDKSKINETISTYFDYNGYSLISHDFASLELINTIVHSFDIYQKISELSIDDIYNLIMGSRNVINCLTFTGCTSLISGFWNLRSFPIEYFCTGNHDYINEFNMLISSKSIYFALDSLKRMFKLDDLGYIYSLTDLMESILQSQFLEMGYTNYGAFLPSFYFTAETLSTEFQNQYIYFEMSYYAIKCLELLADTLNIGSICDLSFNINGLYNYIINHIVDNGTSIYYQPTHYNDINNVFKHTYYMIYILKALNLFNLNIGKIKSFLDQYIDYNDITTIYFSYKIAELLDLEYDFDFELTQKLIRDIYSEELDEFFLTSDRECIGQEVFLWVCEMARNNPLNIETNYKTSIYLGDLNTIDVTFKNIILDDFGPYVSVQFVSNQMGTFTLEKQQNENYQANFLVPISPENYPVIDGFIRIYDKNIIIGEKYISFQTKYDLIIRNKTVVNTNGVSFHVNISYLSYSGLAAASTTRVFTEIYINGTFSEIYNFSRVIYSDYSTFSFDYIYLLRGLYAFDIIMIDDFHSEGYELITYDFNCSLSEKLPSNPEPSPIPEDESEPSPEPASSDSESFNYQKWIILGSLFFGFIFCCFLVFSGKIKKGVKKIKRWFRNKSYKKNNSFKEVEVIVKKKLHGDKAERFMSDFFND